MPVFFQHYTEAITTVGGCFKVLSYDHPCHLVGVLKLYLGVMDSSVIGNTFIHVTTKVDFTANGRLLSVFLQNHFDTYNFLVSLCMLVHLTN